MLESKLSQLEEKAFDRILLNAFDWLVTTFGDRSPTLNKLNYNKKYSSLRRISFKQNLNLVWAYNPNSLPWHYYGQYGEYTTVTNSIILHCHKKYTLGFVLDTLFHEFKHSQQSMSLYQYFRGSYEEHPLEKEAEQFAAEWVPVYSEKKLLVG